MVLVWAAGEMGAKYLGGVRVSTPGPPLLLVGAGNPDGGGLLAPQAPRHLLQAPPPAGLHFPWRGVQRRLKETQVYI